MVFFRYKLRLRTRLLLLLCTAAMLPLLLENILIIARVQQEYYSTAGQRVTTVAGLVAESPKVQQLLLDPDGSNKQDVYEYLDTLGQVSQVRFIVLINMQGIRLYHPLRERIGKPMMGGDEAPVLMGKAYLSSAEGTFGFSLRSFQPIFGPDGVQLGAVVVGKLRDSIDETIANLNRPIIITLILSLLGSMTLAALFAANIKKALLGLEPEEIAKRLEERNAVLSTVREGIVAVNVQGDITLINAAGEEVLRKSGVPIPALGQPVRDAIPGTRLDQVVATGQAEFDCEQHINGTVILTNRVPLKVNGVTIGAIATFRDMTEVRKMAEELTGVNRYVDALRSKSHEFLNKLHVIYGTLENGHYKELSAYLKKLIGTHQRERQTIQHNIKDPVLAGFLDSKFSRAREMGAELTFRMRGVLPPLKEKVHALVTILGNLIDNGLEAVQDSPQKELHLDFHFQADGAIILKVRDTGLGLDPELAPRIFTKGWSLKGEHRGMGLYLVLAAVHQCDGTIEVETSPGQGCRFLVRLPGSSARKAAPARVGGRQENTPPGAEHD